MLIPVIENIGVLQTVGKVRVEAKAGLDIAVIIRRDLQWHKAVGFQRFGCLEDIVGPEGQVLPARSEFLGKEVTGKRAPVFRAVHRDAQRTGVVFNDLAAHYPGWIDDIHHRRFLCFEYRRVEQKPGQHLVKIHGLCHVQYYDDEAVKYLAVESGRADAVFSVNATQAYKAKVNGKTRLVGTVSGGWPITAEVAVTTRKGSGAADGITEALNELIANGKYKQVLDRWNLGYPPGLPNN